MAMGRRSSSSIALGLTSVALAIALLASGVAAHDDSHMDMGHSEGSATGSEMDMGMHHSSSNGTAEEPVLPSYFRHAEFGNLMLAHIVVMGVAWVVLLPLAVTFSIARSRLTLPLQLVFLLANGLGIFLATIYNASTPDLYENNAHHKLGWVVTWLIVAQVGLALLARRAPSAEPGFMPVSTEAMDEHMRLHLDAHEDDPEIGRWSNDSGHGTERNTESLRSPSASSVDSGREIGQIRHGARFTDELAGAEKQFALKEDDSVAGGLMKKADATVTRVANILPAQVLRVFGILAEIINRTSLLIGFVALATGFVTYGGIFRGNQVFSGLAHFIKGAVFLWYGILSLGRWAGCFAEIGWAWNVKPKHSKARSAEFAESALICFYGCTNVFLEHLGSTDSEWSPSDLEHVSLTIMFFGGGLCGMLIESTSIRALLTSPSAESDNAASSSAPQTPITNPLPALIVLLLGRLMSSHHQETATGTAMHAQWGMLLQAAALARIVTYIMTYISPTTSTAPRRPPTELLASFCLISGGFLFMLSAFDTVAAIESAHLHAMLIFTVAVGLVSVLMAWILVVLTARGWAARREARRSGAVGL